MFYSTRSMCSGIVRWFAFDLPPPLSKDPADLMDSKESRTEARGVFFPDDSGVASVSTSAF